MRWEFPDHSKLTLQTNFGADGVTEIEPPDAPVIYASDEVTDNALKEGMLPPWFVAWFLES